MLSLRKTIFSISAICMISAVGYAGDVAADHGLDDLIARLGAGNEPTGADVTVGQVEADESGNYGPDTDYGDFTGKTFTFMSGSTGVSSHATQVGRREYGSGAHGIAPGISQVYVYSAGGWVQSDFLHVGSSGNPGSPPGDLELFNNSWGGTFGSIPLDSEAIRRSDWSVDTNNIMMLNGVMNSGKHAPLMSFGFNCVSVGMANGNHVGGVIPDGYDMSGRQIPLIVASQTTTSNATGVVSAATALLVETAETHPNNVGNYFATLSETTKQVLLTGGKHEAGWTNNPDTSGSNRGRTSQPIDEMLGVGTVNVDRSWQVMAGGQHDSSTTPYGLTVAPYAAWETWLLGNGQSRYIKFNVTSLADEVSIVLTWHQSVNSGFGSYSIADFDLILWKQEGKKLLDITGDAGLGVFGGGNVVSESNVDNIEHLYIQNLSASEYVLEIRRIDSVSGSRVFSVGWLFPEQVGVPGDIDGDGVVGVNDLLMLIAAWGPCPSDCPEDLNGDGIVDVLDILELLSYW